MHKEYLYVLYFPTTEIIEIEITVTDNHVVDAEDILAEHDMNIDDCHFMWSSEKLQLQTLK